MKETARKFGRWICGNWKKLLLVLLAYWLLMTPANVDMETHRFSLPDSHSIGTTTLKTQVHSPLFFWAADPWTMSASAADLPQVDLPANGTTEIQLNFGLLTAPHKIEVAAHDVRDIDFSRSIGLWLKYSRPQDVPHTYAPGLLKIPLSRDDRVPRQLLVVNATWYGILGPKTATYAVMVNGWSAVP